MKKVILMSVVASSIMFAGGDIAPAEPMVVEEAVIVIDSGFYIGAGYSLMNLDNHSEDKDLEWNGYSLIAGYQFNKYFAAEARYSASVGDAELTDDGDAEGDVEADASVLGVYAKGMYPIGNFTPYALLGFAETTVDMTTEGGSKRSDTSFNVGAGASYNFTDSMAVFVDYIYNNVTSEKDYWSEGDAEFSQWTAGLTYKF